MSYCNFWIYWVGVNTKFTIWQQLSYCKFCIYTHPVNSKFTIWQKLGKKEDPCMGLTLKIIQIIQMSAELLTSISSSLDNTQNRSKYQCPLSHWHRYRHLLLKQTTIRKIAVPLDRQPVKSALQNFISTSLSWFSREKEGKKILNEKSFIFTPLSTE